MSTSLRCAGRIGARRALRGPRPVRRPRPLGRRRSPGRRSSSSRSRSPRTSSARSGPAASSSTTSSRPGRRPLLQAELGAPPSAVVVVLHSETAARRHAGVRGRGRARRSRDVPSAPHVARVVPHTLAPGQVSADGHTAYDVVFLSIAPDDSPAALPGIASGPAPAARARGRSWPAVRRSTATSRTSPSPTCGGASSSRCRSPRSRCSFVFGSVVAAALPLAVGGAAVVVALAAIFVDR